MANGVANGGDVGTFNALMTYTRTHKYMRLWVYALCFLLKLQLLIFP